MLSPAVHPSAGPVAHPAEDVGSGDHHKGVCPMRTFAIGSIMTLLAVVIAGCPARRETKDSAVQAVPEPEKASVPPSPGGAPSEVPPQKEFAALREARTADLPVLTPILEYLTSSAVDEEISGLKDMRWLCADDVLNGSVSDEDPENMTVIYRIVDQEDRIAVQVGPPRSEFDLEFHVARKGVSDYMYVGWEPLPGPEE